jgi:uncharacterized membrane protein (UPF0182 family)
MYQFVVGQVEGALLVSLLAGAAAGFLYGGVRISANREVIVSKPFRAQIAILGALYVLVQAANLWINQYVTLVSPSEGFLAAGAGYTEANATIPGNQILAGIAVLVAVFFLVTAFIGRWRLPIIGGSMLVVASIVIGGAYPWIVQRFQVDPSARTLEAQYIQRNIDSTLSAYGLEDVKFSEYAAIDNPSLASLSEDAGTLSNIRLLDPALNSPTFSQLQQIRGFYAFPETLDVDRYLIDGVKRGTVIAVREVNLDGLADDQRNWFNDHMVFTHGYGVVAAYENTAEADGAPKFAESNIPPSGKLDIDQPRVYFGEQSPEYSIVGSDGIMISDL